MLEVDNALGTYGARRSELLRDIFAGLLITLLDFQVGTDPIVLSAEVWAWAEASDYDINDEHGNRFIRCKHLH